MDAVRIEYKRKGTESWSGVGFFTRLPGTFTITPAVVGAAESGNIRARFLKNNSEVGNYSPEHPVTVAG